MTHVALHRPDAAARIGLGQGGHLDRIAEGGTGTVRLHIGDVLGTQPGQYGGVQDHGDAADHRADVVAVGERVGQPLDQHGAGTAAEDGTVGGRRARHLGAAGHRHVTGVGTQRPPGPVQRDEGSWAQGGYHGATMTLDTCFALLFLKRANLASDLTRRLDFVVEGKPTR